MKIIRIEAENNQCWIETVHANGPVAVEMVDGMAKAAADQPKEEAKLL